jgi:Tfp pilus assembly protein PilX
MHPSPAHLSRHLLAPRLRARIYVLPTHCRHTPNNDGFVILTVALLLVVLAALGAASMKSANTQERIAGIFYDRAVALASSESALSDGKSFLLTPDFDGTNAKIRDASGAYTGTTNDGFSIQSWVGANTDWDTQGWTLGNFDNNFAKLARVKSPPSYIIEKFPPTGITSTSKFQVYRINARGAGGRNENAVYTHSLSVEQVTTTY